MQQKYIKNWLLPFIGLGLAFTTLAEPKTLSSDQKPLFPGFSSAQEAANLPQELLGDGNRRFLVLEVDNIEGNDPFDEQQPFFNFDGVRVDSVEQLLALINDGPQLGINDPVVGIGGGDIPPPPASDCQPSSLAADNFGTISITIDPVTGACTLFQGSSGDDLFIQSTTLDSPFSIGVLISSRTGIENFQLLTTPDFENLFFDFFNEDTTVVEFLQVETGAIFTFNIAIEITGVANNGVPAYTFTVFSVEVR